MSQKLRVYIVETPDPSRGIHHYLSNREPLLKSPLAKLPLGCVRARGWLQRQLELMAEGMVGHLTGLSDFLRPTNGWFGTDEDGWEEQPYWFRGFHDLGILLNDKRINDEANRWIEAVIATQDSDGYFGAKYNKHIVGKKGQEVADVWPHMVMLDALINHYEHTSDRRVVSLAERFFRWCNSLPDEQFIPKEMDDFGDWRPFVQTARSGDMLPHLYWLYNITGKTWLLDLAIKCYAKMAPPRGQWLDTHVVNFTQRFRVAGNYYVQSKNPANLAETEYWYEQHMGMWGQQPGGIFGADEQVRPGKTDPKQACETCGIVEFSKSFQILGKVTGQVIYADRSEDIMFNSFPVSQTPDLKALHYLTAANQPQLDASGNHDYNNKGRQIDYSPYVLYRCCQHNVSMGWPYYVEHLWMAAAGDGLAAWLYAACEVKATVGDGVEVTIHEETDYPFEGHVRMTLESSRPVAFPLYLRIPRWCNAATISLNGKALDIRAESGKFVVIEREWTASDVVELNFPMEISLTEWQKSANSVTVNRGPLSYSLKIGEEWRKFGGTDEWPEWEVFPTTPWNYGLIVDRNNPEASFEVVDKGVVLAKQSWTLENAPIEIRAHGKRIPNWTLVDETVTDLQPSPIKSDEPVEEITLVPMGCARLRISCFPTIGEGPDAREWVRYI